ncbi:hypothetical protein CFC21_033700 [Triticum aestivum]|uniref:Uncharacterized protein n=2 Tax=Triticum aestivum TaxID=4565 RepID=A0A3B6E9T1_WHEAT|nr:uncharacterized lipoprotein syc1174_c-like [Triticum aestivum]KAF7020626.1 hypothetical protein CFC21_033700 [Triticum aestivum]
MALHLARPFHPAGLPPPPRRRARARPHSLRPTAEARPPCFRRPYTSVLVVPTGVGAAVGGFAGDALPVARALAAVSDCVISHPNVLNAAMLYWPMPNTLYVEGYALDRFAEGAWALQPVHQNKVGLVLDSGIEEELQLRHLQVADAARASLGLPVVEYTVTDAPLEIKTWFDPKCGKSTGSVGNSDSLLRAVDALVNHAGVNAVAVVARFPDDDPEDSDCYREGKGVDLLAGVEAISSHLIVKEFKIPAAHAPAVLSPPLSPSVSPRSAAEEIGYTFLPCVLAGLSSAPQYVTRRQGTSDSGCIVANDVDSVILPRDACGGDGALAFSRTARKNKPLIITVQENETVLDDTPDKFSIDALNVQNYWEAIGVIAAHKAGINPNALRRQGVDHLKSHQRLYSARSSGRRPYASSPMQDKVYVHQLA